MAAILPKVIVIKSNYFNTKGYFHYKPDGSVALGEESVFSTLAKVHVEPAASNNKYVHFRFSYSNKYWHRKADGSWFIAAESGNPEEDTTKPSCTLFEPIKVEDEPGDLFYLIHVQSGGRLLIDNATMVFYVEFKPKSYQGYLSGVDWDTLVKLPAHVAFKGDNNKYLKAFSSIYNYLQFSSEDANDVFSGHKVSITPDGHVRITSDHFGKLWKRGPDDWILADSSSDDNDSDADTLFWPVKIGDGSTVALRNAGNGKFCRRLSDEEITRCLNAAVSESDSAPLQVEELVRGRKICKVRYLMEYAQISNEEPDSTWSTMCVIDNDKDRDVHVAVAIKHEDSKAFSFGRSSWLATAPGVATTIEAGVPYIKREGSINNVAVDYQISAALQWNNTTTITESATAKVTVVVPARTKALVKYVGTRGTCKVPFSYTQQDTSSTNGRITETYHDDGVFTGVNCYDFKFVIQREEKNNC